MRRTYAPFCSALGLVLGAMVGVKWTNNTALGIVIGVVFAIIAFVIVRGFENAVDKAGDKLAQKASEAYQKHKEQKAMENGVYFPKDNPNTTKFPGSTDAAPSRNCPYCGNPVNADSDFCASCGKQIS